MVAHTASPPRSLKTALWALKTRLQFTGWLQYMPNALAVVVFGALAGLGAVIASLSSAPASWLVGLPLGLASVLALNLVFDVVTVKFELRPREPLPPRREALDAFDLMRARVACRSFQARELTSEHRQELLTEAARFAAPEHQIGTGPVRFEYIAARLTVWPVVGAREFLVAIAPKTYDRAAVVDVGRSLQKVVHHATRMGLATCWIGPGADHASILHHLGPRFDVERDHIICVCAIGYRSRFKPAALRLIQTIQRRRKPLGELFFADSALRRPIDPAAPPFAEFGRCYEVCQWAPSSFNGQPTRAAAIADARGRVARVDFYASTASRFYAPVALGIWLANWELGCEALGLAGHFEALDSRTRGLSEEPELPHYDISWIRAA